MKIEVFVAGVAAVVGVDAAAHQVVGTDCVADIEDGAEKKREPLVIEVATPPDVTTMSGDGSLILADGYAVGVHPERGLVQSKKRIEIG